jgi:hypothetical protein
VLVSIGFEKNEAGNLSFFIWDNYLEVQDGQKVDVILGENETKTLIYDLTLLLA